MTNAEKLRAMTDEELAEFLNEYAGCHICDGFQKGICNSECLIGHLIWLRKEADDAEPVKPALSDDDRKASEAWCENCDHIEMCKWYPTCGCEFRQIGGKPAGRAEPPEKE